EGACVEESEAGTQAHCNGAVLADARKAGQGVQLTYGDTRETRVLVDCLLDACKTEQLGACAIGPDNARQVGGEDDERVSCHKTFPHPIEHDYVEKRISSRHSGSPEFDRTHFLPALTSC